MAQRLLLMSYKEQLHKCHLSEELSQKITLGNDGSHTITCAGMKETKCIEWNGQTCLVDGQQLKLNEQLILPIAGDEKISLRLIDSSNPFFYDTSSRTSFSIGSKEYDDIQISGGLSEVILHREEVTNPFKISVMNGVVYHNFTKADGEIILEDGDQLYIEGMLIKFGKFAIEIIGHDVIHESRLTRLFEQPLSYSPDYPDYHRSPRIIYREPEDKRQIARPSPKPRKPSEQIARIIVPPIVMVAACVIVSLFNGSGIYLIVMLSMTIVTVIFSITTYIKSLKDYRIETKERDVSYRDYLKNKTKELYEASNNQRHALNYHYPNIEQVRDMAVNVNSRIYEKNMFHHDFLMYRVGLGNVKTSFEVELSVEEFTQDKDELMDEARKLRSQYEEIKDVPLTTSLMNGPVGYIGQRHLVVEQLQLLVMQTALFQSYHDVQFITIFPEEEKDQWNWMRWLPHASIQGINVRGFVYHERTRDQVLNSLYQIIKDRKLQVDEKNNNEKIYFSPQFVVLITDEKMVLDHSVMEYLNEDPSHLGVSVVFVQDVMQSLPEHVTTVVDIRDSMTGNIILEKGELVNRRFQPDHFPKNFNKEDVSRALAPLNHLQNLKNSIPEAVTFLEMYGVERVEDLQIERRWRENETYKSLAVPLGLRGKEDIVNLNLHEKAHGPHGLVAGTTGSGKSEIIQSYIISLAVNFHPYEVGFLLIDYKGGGMANLFRDLPHLMGTITNLDGAQSMRALASIKAELQKRQRLFGMHDVNHINQYQKLFKLGEVQDPMPHLFLISDEFAELKSEQPEFMKELVSTARIGRSLGIHLILATQKPSGVVDDQIWSNSKFKLALKVQNSSDSNEILKTPDAAEITLPGRAYLQVGNNEIYELFQSAWSGANYTPEKTDEEWMDTTIYAINELGQYDIISQDLSGLSKKTDISSVPTELDAVVDHIRSYADRNHIEELPKPWLPPLEEKIFLSELHPVDYRQTWTEEKKPLEVTFGFLDIPEMQSQKPLKLNLSRDGHIAVFSSPGYGKSTFLQTVAMDLARQHNPERLHIYLIDLGTNGLLPLKDLPHAADTFMVDEEIKIGKLLRRLENELKERKRKLSQYGVANIHMYERASGEEVPAILMLIDTFDSITDAPYREEMEKIIAQIAREGVSVGVHMVMSAGRQNVLRAQILANIKHQIPLYLIDETETRAIVGKTDLKIEEISGRGLVKLEQPTSFQTALPVHGEEALAIIEGIQRESDEMAKAWTGSLPVPIPMVPEIMNFEALIKKKQAMEILQRGGIPFAVDFENVEPIEIDVMKDPNTLILGDMMDSVENTFHTLLSGIPMNNVIDVGMIDNASSSFRRYREKVDIYADHAGEIDAMTEKLQELFEAREDAFRQAQATVGGNLTRKEFLSELRPMVILITDAVFVVETMSMMNQTTLAKLIENGSRVGIYFILGAVFGAIDRKYDDIITVMKKQKAGVLIGRITDQNILEVINRPYREQNLLPYEAYFIKHGKAEKIKIAAPYQNREEVNVGV